MSLKKKLKNNQLTVGSWIMINSPTIIEVMALAGFDWLVVDTEHTSIDLQETENLIRTIQANKMKALVRVCKNEEVAIKKALDIGADGIIVPMICSKEEAICAVNYAKYPPTGKRGVGLYRAQSYGTRFKEYKKWVEEELVIIAQIEHIDAVKNISEIIKVDGIDGTLIGPYDLSGSMGFPGSFERKDVKNSLQKVLKLCKQQNIPPGFHVVDTNPKALQSKIKQGYTFLVYGIDYLFLRDSTVNLMKNFKNKN